MPNFISEDTIEKAILKRLHEQFGFELLNCREYAGRDSQGPVSRLYRDAAPRAGA